MTTPADLLTTFSPIRVYGKVHRIVGLVVEGTCGRSSIGSLCEILPLQGGEPVAAEIVGYNDNRALLMPLGELRGLGPGSRIQVKKELATISVGDALLGRVIDGMMRPLDTGPPLILPHEQELYALPPDPMQRDVIKEPLDLGIRAINGLLTCGVGQRMGIMAGSGVGKSVLLGMMAKYARADINVIALIGERGREVREFIERDLGPEGLAHSVILAVTSDQSPLLRMRGAFVATAIAEYFCQQGKKRPADDGFGHPVRHGPAGDRPVHRRAPHHQGLHSKRLRGPAQTAGASGQLSEPGLHHRPVYGAGRRRRPDRTGG